MKTSHQYPEDVVRRALHPDRERPSGPHRTTVFASVPELQPLAPWATTSQGASFETGILSMLAGLAHYAGAHVRQYDSPIADDGILGVAWLDAIRGVRALLNGELGRLDGGTLDHAILELHKAAGFEGEL